MTDRTTTQEASRAAFEAWMRARFPSHQLGIRQPVHSIYGSPTEEVEYLNSGAQHKWIGWQAATQARDAECAALRDALTRIVHNPEARIGGDIRAQAVAALKEQS